MILQDVKVHWVGAAISVGQHRRYCIRCQIANAQPKNNQLPSNLSITLRH